MLRDRRRLLTNPSLLVMDEPSERDTRRLVEELIATCRTLADEGIGLLLVEQNLGMATALADRILIMVSGQIRPRERPRRSSTRTPRRSSATRRRALAAS